MNFNSTRLIVLLLQLMAALDVTSPNNRHIEILRSESPKKVPVNRSYVDLLNSLIKVNQERVSALKKLYVLNSVTYGKDVLRTTIENKLDDYDKTQEMLIRTIKHILDNLERAPKTSTDEIDLNGVVQDNNLIFVLPIENYIGKVQERTEIENFLRNKDSDDDSSKEKTKDNSKDVSKSTSSEKLNDEELNEFKGNDTQGRSYYYYGCGRGRIRCIKACKESYREACEYYYCGSSLRKSLRSACKTECKSWFY